MAYNTTVAGRVRQLLGDSAGFEEKKMFGGVCYLLKGNMACGVHGESVILRLGAEDAARLLQMPFARVFDLTGRPMKGWALVDPAVPDEELSYWVNKAVGFATALPAK